MIPRLVRCFFCLFITKTAFLFCFLEGIRTRHRRLFLTVTLTLSLQAACTVNPYSGKPSFALQNHPAERQAMANLAQRVHEYGASMRPNAEARLQQVADRVIQTAGLDQINWSIHALAGNYFYAAAAAGEKNGILIAFDSLLDRISDEALAFIIAHEIAHLFAWHAGEKNMRDFVIKQFSQDGSAVTRLYFPKLDSRQSEHNADRLGLILMALAGYNPDYTAHLFKMLPDLEHQQSTQLFAQTHPYFATRSQQFYQIKNQVQELYQYAQNAILPALDNRILMGFNLPTLISIREEISKKMKEKNNKNLVNLNNPLNFTSVTRDFKAAFVSSD